MFDNIRVNTEHLAVNFSIPGLNISAKFEMTVEEQRKPANIKDSQNSSPRNFPPKNQSRAVYVDFTHLYTSAYKEGLWIDDLELYRHLTQGTEEVFEVFAYLVVRPDQDNKIERLRRIGYQVYPRIIRYRPNEYQYQKRKDIDTWLSFDLSLYSPLIKTLVVVGGDSDYAYGLRKLKEEQNKRIEVVYLSEKTLSNELRKVADKCVPITSLSGVSKPRIDDKHTLKLKPEVTC